jgi:alanine-synthesizing transaminase
MAREFYRIDRLPPYVFAEVNKLKAEARQRGEDIIDFGMGNPDAPTPEHIIDKLVETVRKDPKSHGYSVSQGIFGLRKAISAYYKRRFDVAINVDKEIAVSLGSKEAYAHLAMAISRSGDKVLVTDPSYPIHAYGFIIAGADVHYLTKDFKADNPDQNFLNQVKHALENVSPKPIAVVVNYPCNPTAEVTTLDFYKELVDICHKHDVIIISDLAYCEIYFDDNPPPSILQVPKARDIAVELTSMSKTFSMAGWRIGFTVGNEEIIFALKRLKSYLDYGAFTPLQVAAASALNGPQDCIEGARQRYKERRDIMVQGLADAGWEVEVPQASMFIWAEIPEKFKSMGSMEFSKMLLKEAQVAVSPGIGFGAGGDDYVRISLIENKQRSRQALRNIKQALRDK